MSPNNGCLDLQTDNRMRIPPSYHLQLSSSTSPSHCWLADACRYKQKTMVHGSNEGRAILTLSTTYANAPTLVFPFLRVTSCRRN